MPLSFLAKTEAKGAKKSYEWSSKNSVHAAGRVKVQIFDNWSPDTTANKKRAITMAHNGHDGERNS